ncbi:cytochrome oxidase small assembly protein [Pseudoduganella ginsengisoli]|nr:cytochrome oxidase small assembly protein [Pseudoduganella ginsengisoli]
MSDPKKQNSNLKLALTLGSIALVFFISVFVKRTWLG